MEKQYNLSPSPAESLLLYDKAGDLPPTMPAVSRSLQKTSSILGTKQITFSTARPKSMGSPSAQLAVSGRMSFLAKASFFSLPILDRAHLTYLNLQEMTNFWCKLRPI